MNLSSRLAGDFSVAVRKRGQQYYWQRRVRIENGSHSHVEARVQGSRTYDVSLNWNNGVLFALCDCGYFDSDGACKHLWATILASEARGHLSLAANSPGLILDCDAALAIEHNGVPSLERRSPFVLSPSPPPQPVWLKQLAGITSPAKSMGAEVFPSKRQILYVVDVTASVTAGCLVLSLASRDRKVDGTWTRPSPLNLKRSQIPQLPVPEDREILSTLAGCKQYYGYGYLDSYEMLPASCSVLHPLSGMIMPMAIRTERCYLRGTSNPEDLTSLTWDDGLPWNFAIKMARRDSDGWAVTGFLVRGEQRMDLSAARLVTKGGLVFTATTAAPLAEDAAFDWIFNLRKFGGIQAPDAERDELLGALLCSPGLPAIEVPEELRYEEVTSKPQPRLHVLGARPTDRSGRLKAELSFQYGGLFVPAREFAGGFFDAQKRQLLRRDLNAEKEAASLLHDLGLKLQNGNYNPEPAWEVAPQKLPRVARTLVEAGWHIEADGKIFRRSGEFRMHVSSGLDWFELHGEVEYGDTKAKLPALLESLRRGENIVRLDDGTYGLLPEEWLRRIGMLAGLGTPGDGHIRFRRSQAGLLDALLAAQPEARCDETFTRVRKELALFQGVAAAPQPDGFVGQLRDYQREGLGWMHFLRQFSFGGCLADDMGVGKTAQVLALLEERRASRAAGETIGPSLVVVPRSLVFNWKQEAERFTPQLRVLDYTGLARGGNGFAGYDMILTTYGTLRRDVIHLKDVEFDYIVLDEAQAIKNAGTESAKAVRLLHGGNRLALSGTPVENHLGELWSLFEFLNPGMLGAASVFKLTGTAGRNPDEETRRLLAHALRPFILRRTKDQVARELPARTEQTVYCEMDASQRKLYNELRKHYRDALLQRIETDGLAKSKIQVLEALLRLRQAACHPGLIDKKRSAEPSAKLEVLLEQLREVLDERHKALVFSQFTSLLKIVRERLDANGVVYEYLDGATRDRQARVERFQNDSDCKLFLISLKAGGLGLNLTAAEYVFLLDPWWNPAVEAQAVDRAHRIGQTRQVFAYRLIARDTVEEKVLELQKTKRDLAESIISQDNSVIRNLGKEDLELLLS